MRAFFAFAVTADITFIPQAVLFIISPHGQPGFTISIVKALTDSWVLLVEINR